MRSNNIYYLIIKREDVSSTHVNCLTVNNKFSVTRREVTTFSTQRFVDASTRVMPVGDRVEFSDLNHLSTNPVN